MSADHEAIRELIATWLRETQAGNVDAVLELMAPDVVFLVPGQAPMVGREPFAKGLRNMLESHRIDSVSTIEEIEVSGDLAYCRTSLAVTVTPHTQGKPPMRRSGHTLTILRQDADGRWRLTRDANLLAPVREAAAF